MRSGVRRRVLRGRRRDGRRRAAAAAAARRRHGARQGLARRGPGARRRAPGRSARARRRTRQPRLGHRRRRARAALMGRILFGGTAALLICMFLSPKFIEFLREREFGQHIREDGPEGHHQKAGTPTMGGIIIFIAIAVPFLILTDYDWRSVGVFGAAIACALLGFADDYIKIVAALAGPAGAHEADRHDRDLAGPLVRRALSGASGADAATALRRLPDRPRLGLSAADLPRRRGHDQRGQPHRRPRRPRGGVCGDRAAGVHRHHVHHRRGRPGDARRLPGRRRASASSGSTRSRRRSSWAIPAHWGWAGRSPASR